MQDDTDRPEPAQRWWFGAVGRLCAFAFQTEASAHRRKDAKAQEVRRASATSAVKRLPG